MRPVPASLIEQHVLGSIHIVLRVGLLPFFWLRGAPLCGWTLRVCPSILLISVPSVFSVSLGVSSRRAKYVEFLVQWCSWGQALQNYCAWWCIGSTRPITESQSTPKPQAHRNKSLLFLPPLGSAFDPSHFPSFVRATSSPAKWQSHSGKTAQGPREQPWSPGGGWPESGLKNFQYWDAGTVP